MKLTVSRRSLHALVHRACAVTEHRNTLPILEAVLIEASGEDSVSVTAYDLETSFVGSTGVSVVMKPGKVAVAGKALAAVLATLPEGDVLLTVEKNRLVIDAGDVSFRLATVSADDFPALPESKTGVTFRLDAAKLTEAFTKVAYCASFDETRYSLNGVLLEVLDGKVVTTATDGHRLAHHEVVAETATDAGGGVIVPRKAVKLLSGLAGDVSVTVSENTLAVLGEGWTVTTRLIDGSFPDYRAIIPVHEGPGATFDRKALLAMLGRMKLVSDSVLFTVVDDRMTLTSKDPDRGEASEWCVVTGVPKTRFGLNGGYLRESLSSWTSDTVSAYLPTDDTTPILLKDGECADSWAVIMPMRT